MNIIIPIIFKTKNRLKNIIERNTEINKSSTIKREK
jgi:hypothetical protein